MIMIQITGWKTGFNKIQFGALLRECCGLSLSEGKKYVESVLEGTLITVTVAEDQGAYFLERAASLGAICELKKT